MKDEPVMASIILLVVLFHVIVLIYGFLKLYSYDSPSSSSSTEKAKIGRMKRFPGADEELKKLIQEHKIE